MTYKKWGSYLIVIVILAMLVSATLFVVVGNQNGTAIKATSGANNSADIGANFKPGLSDMYVYVPGGNPNDTRTTVPGDGSPFNYTPSGARFNLSYGTAINVSISITNHLDRNVLYSLYANELRTDYINNTIEKNIMRHLSIGPVGKNETITTWFLIDPVLIGNHTVFDWDPGNSTPISFDLMDYTGNVETSMLNSTMINCLFNNP